MSFETKCMILAEKIYQLINAQFCSLLVPINVLLAMYSKRENTLFSKRKKHMKTWGHISWIDSDILIATFPLKKELSLAEE